MKKLQVDYTLRVNNCSRRNLVWVKDTIYDPNASELVNQELFLLDQKGYKLGMPAIISLAQNHAVGLYRPIN